MIVRRAVENGGVKTLGLWTELLFFSAGGFYFNFWLGALVLIVGYQWGIRTAAAKSTETASGDSDPPSTFDKVGRIVCGAILILLIYANYIGIMHGLK